MRTNQRQFIQGQKVLRLDDLYSCLSERRGFCCTELISVRAVDVIVLKFWRPSVLLWEGPALHVVSEVVICSITLLPTCSQRKKKTKLPFQIFPTAANKFQMLDFSCFSRLSPSLVVFPLLTVDHSFDSFHAPSSPTQRPNLSWRPASFSH